MFLGLALVLLAIPLGHQIVGHRVGLRRFRPGPTAHELAHRSRPLRLRVLANVGWVLYLAASFAVVLALR